jgi:hypothetical protein
MQPIYGGYAPAGSTTVASQAESQALSFSAHPYVRERFGDLGSAELGAMLSRTSQSGLPAAQLSSLSASQLASLANSSANGGAQSLTSEQEYLTLASGPAFGRVNAGLSLSGTEETGSGVASNARRDQATVTLGYAITHTITALASVGYDDSHYGGPQPYNFSGLDWSGGGRWIPNPDSSITVTYGSQEGVDSLQVDATYAPTARTRVFARYSEGISTGLEQLLNAMNGSSLDPLGNSVGSDGVPVQLLNSFYGLNDNLARVTNASITGVLLRERDSISATFNRQQSHQIAVASVNNAASLDSTGLYGSLNWQRDLRPDLQSSAFVQWGATQSSSEGVSQNSDLLVFSLRLTYLVSQTMNAYAQYSWTHQSNIFLSGSVPTPPANLIIVGAHKTF